MKRRTRLVLVSLSMLLLPLTAVAADYATDTVIVPQGEVIEDNFVRAAKIIEINGDIHGDLVLAAQTIVVNGSVSGDILAAAQTIEIHGPVAGNVRLAAGDITINASIGKNATMFASTIELTDNANIGWSLQAFGSSLDLRGDVIGNANFYGSSASIRGDINGNAAFELGKDGALRVAAPASIGKDLSYRSRTDAAIDDAVTVGGVVRQLEPLVRDQEIRSTVASFVSFWKLVSVFGLLVVGLLFLSFFPKTTARITETMRKRSLASLGWGLVTAIVVPIVAVILLMTIIGIPLAVITIILYVMGLYLTRIFLGLWLGQWLLGLLWKGKQVSLLWSMIVGVVIVTAIGMVPYLGWLVSILGGFWALGALVLAKRDNIRMTEK